MGSSSEIQQNHVGHQNHNSSQQSQPHTDDDKKQTYNLCWNEFPSNLLSFFKELREAEEFVDVTLACEGQQVAAHKVVLSACSPYFRSLLKNNPCDHPIVILNEVRYTELLTLLQYMYHGEVQIAHDQITDFLRTAKLLQVRGLAEAAAGESKKTTPPDTIRENGPSRHTPTPTPTPTPKAEAQDLDEDVRTPDSPQVKRIKLSSSVTHLPPSSPSLLQSCGQSPPAPTPPITSLPPSITSMASMASLNSLPPVGIPGLSLPLSLPSSITALPPVTTAHPSAMHHARTALHTPTTAAQPSYPGLYPGPCSEDTQDTVASDRSEDRDNKTRRMDDDDHESTLEKMSGLANMAALKGFGGFPGPSGLVGLASAALGSNPDSSPGCAGSRDLDLSLLLSQLGGVDPPPPLQQGAQLSSAGPSQAPQPNLHMWQHGGHVQHVQYPGQGGQGVPQEGQQRPWCEECGRSYSTVGNLKQHLANVHGRGEWVTCGVCGKTFKTRQYLQSHLLQQHGIRQRPAPFLPPCPPCTQPLDTPQHSQPQEPPATTTQTPPFNPAYRPYHSQAALCPALPQSTLYNNTQHHQHAPNHAQPPHANHAPHNHNDLQNLQHQHHNGLQYGQPSSSSSSFPNNQQTLPPPSAPPLPPPQPDSSGQAASPPPPTAPAPAAAQGVKQERFSFASTPIKQEVGSDGYYTI